jgi:hypothetical protein
MKKILGSLVLVVLILTIGLYFTGQYFLGSIAKAGVNKYGPGITQTPVKLNGAHISPFSGVGTLSGLTVGNPTGWSAGDALSLGKIHVQVEPMSLFKDVIVINELIIEQPEFLYETKIIASNIGDLLKNVEASMGPRAAQPQTEEGKPIKMIIKKLVLREGRVKLGLGTQVTTLPMPEIDMMNLGVAEGGATPTAIAYAVMRNVTTNIVAASAGAMGQVGGTSGAAAVEAAKQAGEAIKGFFSGEKKKQP